MKAKHQSCADTIPQLQEDMVPKPQERTQRMGLKSGRLGLIDYDAKYLVPSSGARVDREDNISHGRCRGAWALFARYTGIETVSTSYSWSGICLSRSRKLIGVDSVLIAINHPSRLYHRHRIMHRAAFLEEPKSLDGQGPIHHHPSFAALSFLRSCSVPS